MAGVWPPDNKQLIPGNPLFCGFSSRNTAVACSPSVVRIHACSFSSSAAFLGKMGHNLGIRMTANFTPSFLEFAQADMSLREQRQSLIASNISNASTPGFKARDIDFESDLTKALENKDASPVGHVEYKAGFPVGLDGNDVSMTAEKLESLSNVRAMSSEVTYLHQSTSDLITALRPNPNGI